MVSAEDQAHTSRIISHLEKYLPQVYKDERFAVYKGKTTRLLVIDRHTDTTFTLNEHLELHEACFISHDSPTSDGLSLRPDYKALPKREDFEDLVAKIQAKTGKQNG